MTESGKKEGLGYRARKWAFQRLTSGRGSNQFDRLSEADWDILVILDACRADTLRNAADWPVETVTSPASCTPEWLKEAASYGVLEEKVVVSGNPQYRKVGVDLGCEEIEPSWKNHWDEKLQTTLPEPLLNRVCEVSEEGSKGVVAHLQQPHWPYVARLGDKWFLAYDGLGPWSADGEKVTSVQVAMQRGLIDVESARRAYTASVHSVWNFLVDYLAEWVADGQTVVVTADHGETFGRFRDFGFYEHPCGCHVAPLVEVPWMEIEDRTDIRETSGNVDERLQALGYAD